MNRLGFQARILLISLVTSLPACTTLLVLLWTGDHEPGVRYGLSLLAVGTLSGGLILLYRKLTFQFQTPRAGFGGKQFSESCSLRRNGLIKRCGLGKRRPSPASRPIA